MHSPQTLPQEHADIGLMFGMSTGKDDIHDAEKIPLGAARYMLAADHVRRQLGAEGTLFIGNRREKTKPQVIDRRLRRLRALAAQLIPETIVLTEQELPADVLERVEADMHEAGIDDLLAFTSHPEYKRWQNRVVGATLLRNGYTRRLKYGCEATEDGERVGEHQFDEVLLPEWGIEPVYGPMDRGPDGHWEVPYLLNTRRQDRVCVPLRANGIDAELAKIKPGIRRITLSTWKATGLVILGEADASVLHSDELAADPLPEQALDEVADNNELEELRAVLREALSKLCQ